MAYIYDMTDTWNSLVTTYTAIKMNVTDTASAAGSLLMDLQIASSTVFSVRKDGTTKSNTFTDPSLTFACWTNNGLRAGSAYPIGFTQSASAFDTLDVSLYRDAANTLAQRNGTSAQEFRVYNTYTNASNNEYGSFSWLTNILQIGAVANGSGVQRAVTLFGASLNLAFGATPTTAWTVNSSGHFLTGTDNTYDIGASGATRPRIIYPGMVIKYASLTLASLSASVIGAASAGAGAMAYISDGNVPIVFTTVAGGGTTPCPVYSDGTQWRAG